MKNRIRITFQLIFLVLILYVAVRPLFDKAYLADFEQYCPFGGISSFFSQLNNGTMACNMNETQVFLGFALILGIGIIGKLFCSYVCPIGTVTEWLGKFGDKIKWRREMNPRADRYLRILKYLLLFITVYYTMNDSELFCKKFDPYFASVNGFNNTDIVLWYAVPVFLFTIIGAILYRLPWCKYLCPLGALSNIFMNIVLAAGVIGIFIVANLLGAGLGFFWLLGGLVLAGIINELGFMKSFLLPFPKITKGNSCSNCGLCDSKCPQGIKISEMEVVNHIDCNLCTDCVYECPKANVLTVGKKKGFKYLAPVMVVVLIAAGIIASNFVEFKTISLRWKKTSGTEAVYTQEGLKNIKCYGSAMALAGTLEGVEGITGLDAYAKTHKAVIYYDPSVISEEKVKEALFAPAKVELRDPPDNSNDPVEIMDIGIYGLFDQVDFNNLYYIFRENKAVYGFETHYGEPVIATVYYNPVLLPAANIKKMIEKKFIVIESKTGSERIELSFKADGDGSVKERISTHEYMRRIFAQFDSKFNSFEDYKESEISVFKFQMPDAGDPSLQEFLPYLASHLSSDPGILRISTAYSNGACAYIFFDNTKTKVESIKSAITKEKLTYFISDTETESMSNPFTIKPEGEIIKCDKAYTELGFNISDK